MKKLHKIHFIGLLVCFTSITSNLFAQEEEKPELMLNVSHYTSNNSLQYLKVKTQFRADNKIQPVKDVTVQLYLDSIAENNLISKMKTNENGEAETSVPVKLKEQWAASTQHKFIAVAGGKTGETVTELQITKAKIIIDTANADGTRSVTAQVFSFINGEWMPAADVEVKLGIKRFGGTLKIGEEETYTTDSSGKVSGEFKLDSLPASDAKGNIVLVAKVEDNDQFGNLSVEKTVPWGRYYRHQNTFGRRSLWAAQFRSPLWLLFMAYSIIGSVWGVIIYLVFSIFQIKKSGKNRSEPERAGDLQKAEEAIA